MSHAVSAEIQISVPVNQIPEMPAQVEIEFIEGLRVAVNVKWEAVKLEGKGQPCTFQIKGTAHEITYLDPWIFQRADPHVLKHTDGYYYFTASVPEYDRIILRKARTLSGLREAHEAVIWVKHETGEMGNHIWAPEIHFIHGKWYIYFAAGTAEDRWAIRPYVLECSDADPMTGQWIEKGKIFLDFESFSLDATTFHHRGEQYLIWAQYQEKDSNLYIAKMANPWTISGPQVLIAKPEHHWEIQGFRVNEGPAVLMRDGRIFVTYSASATDHNYCMGLLEASLEDDLLDARSWRKQPSPVFQTNEETSNYGPGHNCFTVCEDGSLDLIVFHARPYRDLIGSPLTDPNRHAHVQVISWNEDGTPCLGTPGRTAIDVTVIAQILVQS
ncbi:family 43 glycosylhydrolase [Paenibacillus sp. Soil750]|uniref:family 43 glycosylhydrolase n=1 Tax=Paenibacillus sp. Soil750 TaxID=1736398 RepID=UPI0006FA1E6C|nr:family 43 glycosylhydrolase [Paenibacillus sp. Soil750]KRE57468.1 alpha-N-arabinofuranosidase [Paenibacillus sp. Soil750]